MAIPLRKLWNRPKKAFGPPRRVTFSLNSNLENIFRIDHQTLISALPLWEKAGNVLDYANADYYIKNGAAYWKNDGVSCTDLNSGFLLNSGIKNSFNVGFNPYTFIANIDYVSTNYQYIMSIGNVSPGFAISNSDEAYIYDGGFRTFSGVTILEGRQSLAYVRESVGTDKTYLYVDGIYKTSTTHSDSIPLPSEIVIANSHISSPYEWNGIIKQILFFNINFTSDKLLLFSENPYALWQRVAPVSFFFPSSAGGGFLLNADISWKIRTVKESDTAWNILNQTSGDTSWKLLTESTVDSSWKVLTELSESAAWKILNSEDTDFHGRFSNQIRQTRPGKLNQKLSKMFPGKYFPNSIKIRPGES